MNKTAKYAKIFHPKAPLIKGGVLIPRYSIQLVRDDENGEPLPHASIKNRSKYVPHVGVKQKQKQKQKMEATHETCRL